MINNQVVFASAGNGKTYKLVKKALEKSSQTNKQILLISYTNEGASCLQNELQHQTNFLMNNKIEIRTWYSFLLNECVKPYQCLIELPSKNTGKLFVIPPNYINSIDFNDNKVKTHQFASKNNIEYFINSNHDLIMDNVSDFAWEINKVSGGNLIKRLEEIYDYIFIDEVQDYAGWDLEFFDLLLNSMIEVYFVGDIRQVTYKTNTSIKNKQYRGRNIVKWFEEKQKEQKCLISYDNKTRRFNELICKFINSIYPNDKIHDVVSENNYSYNENIGVYIIKQCDLKEYCNVYLPTILRWNVTKQIDIKDCKIYNYGNSKGLTCDRVVIYLPSTIIPFIKDNMPIEKEITQSKFYVACTRAKFSIVLVDESFFPKMIPRFVETYIFLPNGVKIHCYKYNM